MTSYFLYYSEEQVQTWIKLPVFQLLETSKLHMIGETVKPTLISEIEVKKHYYSDTIYLGKGVKVERGLHSNYGTNMQVNKLRNEFNAKKRAEANF